MVNYRMSRPAITPGEYVSQGHVDYCRDHGHARHTVDGVLQVMCPRCGDAAWKSIR